MSVNTAHANNGVLIHSGEYILLHSKNACISFSENKNRVFQGHKHGCCYLTSHRMIFKTKALSDLLLSFSAPFIAMSDVDFHTSDNSIKGTVRAQPNGNYTGEVKFSLFFKSGGISEYAKALRCAASYACDNWQRICIYPNNLPPYTPARAWYEAPEAVYKTPKEYCYWLPACEAFPKPKPNSVFMTDNPAPYPGIGKTKRCRDWDPFKEPPFTGKCPTPKHSFDGFGQPPKYGFPYYGFLVQPNTQSEGMREYEPYKRNDCIQEYDSCSMDEDDNTDTPRDDNNGVLVEPNIQSEVIQEYDMPTRDKDDNKDTPQEPNIQSEVIQEYDVPTMDTDDNKDTPQEPNIQSEDIQENDLPTMDTDENKDTPQEPNIQSEDIQANDLPTMDTDDNKDTPQDDQIDQ